MNNCTVKCRLTHEEAVKLQVEDLYREPGDPLMIRHEWDDLDTEPLVAFHPKSIPEHRPRVWKFLLDFEELFRPDYTFDNCAFCFGEYVLAYAHAGPAASRIGLEEYAKVRGCSKCGSVEV